MVSRSDLSAQVEKAQRFLALHHADEPLVLPNVWDALGARILQSLEFPAVATASAAVANSLGYRDGEVIPFESMLAAVGRIATSVDLPVTADIESGYATRSEALAENIERLLLAGVIGINLEDGLPGRNSLRSIEEQCHRIETVRQCSRKLGVPLVLNARIDTYLHSDSRPASEVIEETIRRGVAYKSAGADCLYPIGMDNLDELGKIHWETKLPLNCYAMKSLPDQSELLRVGVRRISMGAGMMRSAYTQFIESATSIRDRFEIVPVLEKALTSKEFDEFARPRDSE